jgi:hypothetical protein
LLLMLTATAGLAAATPSKASAAVPCGLTGSYTSPQTFRYTIRNCHGFTVWREIDVDNGPDDGTCHRIPAHSSRRGAIELALWEGINKRGIKPC